MRQQLHKRVSVETVRVLFGEYRQGRLSYQKVCYLLKIGKSRFFELYKRYLYAELGGEPFFLYKARSRPTREFLPEEQEFFHKEFAYIKSLPPQKRDYNFEVIAEEAHKRFNRRLYRSCIRRFAIRHGYYDPCQEKAQKPYKQFEMSSIGTLFQHDDSQHVWIPSLGQAIYLIATVDDHSRLILRGSLVEHAGAWEHMKHAEAISKEYGLPGIWYLDRHSIFTYKIAHKSVCKQQRIGDEGETQFALMMAELGVSLWFAPTPQAKGKIENKFKYLQARVPYLCLREKAGKVSEGQEIVDEVIEYYNTQRVHEETREIPKIRWDRAIREGRCCLRAVPGDIDWDHVSAFKRSRTVDGYGTLSYRVYKYKLRQMRNKRVTMCENISVYDGKQKLATFYFEH